MLSRIVGGRCYYEVPEVGRGRLETGNCFLLTAPPAWFLRSTDDQDTVAALEHLPPGVLAADSLDDNDPADVRIVGGYFAFNPVNTDLLLPFLSPVVPIRAVGGKARGRLEQVLAMINAEVLMAVAGQDAVLTRLLEIVLIELLRSPGTLAGQHRGMLVGLMDPQVGGSRTLPRLCVVTSSRAALHTAALAPAPAPAQQYSTA